MLDERLEDQLRSAFRQAQEGLSLSVTAAELERRLTARRRTRTAQRSVLAAAVGILAVAAIVGSAPWWFRQATSEVAATASPRATTPATTSPSAPSPPPVPAADATPTGAPATGVPIIRYLGYDWHAFEIAIDGTGRRAVPDFDIKPELGVDPDAPWVTDKNASPDGRFTVIVNGDEVHVQPIDASASDTIFAVPLGDGSRNARMSWSPDSRYLAVWSGGSGALTPHSMWLLDVTRGTTTAGPIGSIGFIQSAWSPDGAHIAVGGREGMNVTTASTGETEVLRMGADVSGYMDLEWAPDGRSLTFGPMTADYEIHRVNADATGRKRLAVGTGAKWMPDGSRIAFLAPSADLVGPGWQFQIWTMRPDGSDKRPLVTEPCPCSGLKWSADGRWLIFIASHGEHDDIWVVGADGRNARRLARDANIVEWVSP